MGGEDGADGVGAGVRVDGEGLARGQAGEEAADKGRGLIAPAGGGIAGGGEGGAAGKVGSGGGRAVGEEDVDDLRPTALPLSRFSSLSLSHSHSRSLSFALCLSTYLSPICLCLPIYLSTNFYLSLCISYLSTYLSFCISHTLPCVVIRDSDGNQRHCL